MMQVSPKGIELIKEFEGFKSKAYICPANKLTIGYGTVVTDAMKAKLGSKTTTGITQEEAEQLLINHCNTQIIPKLDELIKVKLTQNQIDVLISFIYNIGIPRFTTSTALRLINENKLKGAAEQFKRWNKITKNNELVPSPGLIRRREYEAKLFLE